MNGHAQVVRKRLETFNGNCSCVGYIYGEHAPRLKRFKKGVKQPSHISHVLHAMRAHNIVVPVAAHFKRFDGALINGNPRDPTSLGRFWIDLYSFCCPTSKPGKSNCPTCSAAVVQKHPIRFKKR